MRNRFCSASSCRPASARRPGLAVHARSMLVRWTISSVISFAAAAATTSTGVGGGSAVPVSAFSSAASASARARRIAASDTSSPSVSSSVSEYPDSSVSLSADLGVLGLLTVGLVTSVPLAFAALFSAKPSERRTVEPTSLKNPSLPRPEWPRWSVSSSPAADAEGSIGVDCLLGVPRRRRRVGLTGEGDQDLRLRCLELNLCPSLRDTSSSSPAVGPPRRNRSSVAIRDSARARASSAALFSSRM